MQLKYSVNYLKLESTGAWLRADSKSFPLPQLVLGLKLSFLYLVPSPKWRFGWRSYWQSNEVCTTIS